MKFFSNSGNFFKYVFSIFIVMLLVSPLSAAAAAGQGGQSGKSENNENTVDMVICNVIKFVQKLGLPIMTGVIIGSSIMAIFGRLAWPAIVVLVVFTAIFFGAGTVVSKFAGTLTNVGDSCT